MEPCGPQLAGASGTEPAEGGGVQPGSARGDGATGEVGREKPGCAMVRAGVRHGAHHRIPK